MRAPSGPAGGQSDVCEEKKVQCSGDAKSTKKRCRRMVDIKYALGDNKTAYCFQHRYQSVEFKRKNNEEEKKDQSPITNSRPYYKCKDLVDPTFTNEVTSLRPTRQKKNGFSTFWRRLFCMYVDGPPNQHRRFGANNYLSTTPSTAGGDCVNVYKAPRVSPATSAKYVRLLAEELKKPISRADEAGYIYVYELPVPDFGSKQQQCSSDTVLYLKIGRSKNVDRRMHEWTAQCSRALILTGHFPSLPARGIIGKTATAATSKKCRAVHRAERLIHLELRAMFPCSADQSGHHMFPASLTDQYGLCAACGKRHLEFFKVGRLDADIVVRIISKWIEYVGVI
ncbi:hypothetical protein V1509DRAFT_433779 [Lipomyces kononenkoae]